MNGRHTEQILTVLIPASTSSQKKQTVDTVQFSANATRPTRGFQNPLSIRLSPRQRASHSPRDLSLRQAASGGPNAWKTIKRLRTPCTVLGYGDLASRPINWPDLTREGPEQLTYRHEPFNPRPHQQEAFDDVLEGFKTSDRGKLIMACGTGKTFTALRIAEALAGLGGRVLYLVPSIGLFSQAMREWAEQQEVPHRYIGICSDTRAGRTHEDASVHELEIPVTTDPEKISEALGQTDANAMTVVFCTYHSLPIVENAQDQGAPAFDLILCDEAHRTTGIEPSNDTTSPFVLVHNPDRIRAS